MKVFPGLMGQMARHNDFSFHWHCEREITHLCFADDLMIFCRAEVGSVSLVWNCLNQFWVASLFLCGVEANTKLQLLDALDYREGKLSVMYLGVLIITTKLSSHDFFILVDRIMAKLWVG